MKKKIQEINNLLNNNNTNINISQSKLSELKLQKNNLNNKKLEIEENLTQHLKNKDIQIKLKESMKNEIENKIQEYKYKLNTLNFLTFNPIITKQIFPNNKVQNEILSNEQINDILINIKDIKNISEEENKITNEILNINIEKEKNLNININNLKLKMCQINELLKMLKEDKYSTTNEIINIISCKESIDALIKFNHYLIKNYTKENNQNNNLGNEDIFKDEKILDEEIYNKNKWVSPIKIFFYEICALESEQFSLGFNDIIIDIYDINNLSNINKVKNNSELSRLISKKNGNNNIKKENINNFSISKTIKKEFEFFVRINKNNNLINDDNIKKNFLEKISTTIINKLKLFISKKYQNDKFNEINKNIIIYLSYYVKSLYYENIINGNLKFINKEYKYYKKELQNISNDLNVEIKKLELNQNELNYQINNSENEIKNIQRASFRKQFLDNLQNEDLIYLTKNEQEYLQLCLKINNLSNQSEEVDLICDKINKEFESKKEEIELEKNKINKEILSINNEIKILEEELENKKLQLNKEIIEYRKIIANSYTKIKSELKFYKNKYGDKSKEYNSLLNNIDKIIKNKDNNININIKDINNNQKNGNIYSNNINSYEDNEKNNNINKFDEQINNINDDKYYNLELSSSKFNSTKRDKPINTKLKLSRENKNINLYSSNKLQKHINFLDKYFSNNSNKDNNLDENQKSSIKSSTQLNFYPSFKENNKFNNSVNSADKKNLFNKNIYNTPLPIQDNSARITSLLDKYSKNIPYNDININRNKDSSFNINKTLHSLRNEKLPYRKYFNDNLYSKNYHNKNEDELSKTISELKNNIIQKEKVSNIFLDKIKILTKITFCYFRKTNNNYSKFNPINKISNENLCKEPYYFIKSSISLNKSYKSIRIGLTNQLDPIDIDIKDIEYTIVRTSVKMIIEIYRDYKQWKKNGKENCNKDFFIKNEMEKYSNLNYDYINKCIDNKNFNFNLLVKKKQQMEFVFCSYDDFKTWINGLAFIIKNKNKLLEI